MFHRTTRCLLDTSKRILYADSLRKVTEFDNYDKHMHRFNICSVFDTALNTVADVLPDTLRIEVARWRRLAHASALQWFSVNPIVLTIRSHIGVRQELTRHWLVVYSASYLVELSPTLPYPTRRLRSSTSPTRSMRRTTTTSCLVQFHPTWR